jgi:hypothetical protein
MNAANLCGLFIVPQKEGTKSVVGCDHLGHNTWYSRWKVDYSVLERVTLIKVLSRKIVGVKICPTVINEIYNYSV